jgi:hypothetical protein
MIACAAGMKNLSEFSTPSGITVEIRAGRPEGLGLGERGPVWWGDGWPDLNRHMAKNTLYAEWYAKLARSDQGGM